jgi:hypothetical protein
VVSVKEGGVLGILCLKIGFINGSGDFTEVAILGYLHPIRIILSINPILRFSFLS